MLKKTHPSVSRWKTEQIRLCIPLTKTWSYTRTPVDSFFFEFSPTGKKAKSFRIDAANRKEKWIDLLLLWYLKWHLLNKVKAELFKKRWHRFYRFLSFSRCIRQWPMPFAIHLSTRSSCSTHCSSMLSLICITLWHFQNLTLKPSRICSKVSWIVFLLENVSPTLIFILKTKPNRRLFDW